MKIKLTTINDVNNFVNASAKYHENDIDVKQGRQIINGKSILGIFSLNLMKPIEVIIDTDNKNIEKSFYDFVKKWKVDEE